ncbi:MAG: hypothetical protein HYR94_00485 [Chloroflexi bacterium]|nr:hypothetical protein [Chloroflexota bacterium]
MKENSNQVDTEERDELRPEYDLKSLKGGVRGKYYQAYRAGHTVKIHKTDGTTEVQYFTLEDGAVLLEPDVREYFPDSEAVNKALRCLIPLMSKKRRAKVKA